MDNNATLMLATFAARAGEHLVEAVKYLLVRTPPAIAIVPIYNGAKERTRVLRIDAFVAGYRVVRATEDV